MPEAAETRVVYDSFGAGEYGTRGGQHAPDGSWTGTNVVVYKSGAIGPRPGLRQLGIFDLPVGEVKALGHTPTPNPVDPDVTAAATHWFVVGTKFYTFRVGNIWCVEADEELDAAIPDPYVVGHKGDLSLVDGKVFFAVPGDGIYNFQLNTNNLSRMFGGAEGGPDREMYRDRLVYPSLSARIRYSDAADFTDFSDATAYFDVGYSWQVLGVHWFRDELFIITQNGSWILTGSLGTGGEQLRKNSNDIYNPYITQLYDPSTRSLFIVDPNSLFPSVFNGATNDFQTLRHLSNWAGPLGGQGGAAYSYGTQTVFFASRDGKALWRKEGVWSKHDFGVDVGAAVAPHFDSVFVIAGSGEDAGAFYTAEAGLQRPAFTSDTFCRPGDDTDTPLPATFTMPEWRAPTASEVQVRQVIVDFRKYATGSATPNEIKVRVGKFGEERRSTGVNYTETKTWTEAGTSATTDGVPDRWVINTGERGFASGFVIDVPSVKGVAIEKITVIVRTNPSRPQF